MKYMGSKARIAKFILPIMLKGRVEGQYYVEPFVGGANSIERVKGNRIGADANKYVICALELIRDNPQSIPKVITEDEYQIARYDNDYDCGLRGFIGFTMSFGARFFEGYRRDKAGQKGCPINMATQTRRSRDSAIKQGRLLQEVTFIHSDYKELDIPPKSIIYCDPPYEAGKHYSRVAKVIYTEFWEWCREQGKLGHTVYVSEYNAPDDFECVWFKGLTNTLNVSNTNKDAVERLFKYKGEING